MEKNFDSKVEIMEKALRTFESEMVSYVDENFEGEKGMSEKEASTFLGFDVRGWDQEDIDVAVEDMQRAYYTSGECSFEELVEVYAKLA